MSQTLKNELFVENLQPGASVTLAHGLKDEFKPLAPDVVFVPSPDLSVSGQTDTTVTFLNSGGDPITATILVEAWHTIERSFDGTQNTDLPVKPYVVVSAESNGGTNWPVFPSPSVQRIIYANATGSDSSGKGTQAMPYRTFQRAVRDLPRQVAPNEFWRVDITDLGPELLPPNYAIPALDAPFGGDFTSTFPFPNVPFNTQLAVEIIARPKLASLGGPNPQFTCTAAVADADTNLVAVTTDQNYPLDSLKGKLVQCLCPDGLQAICGVIWHNTAGPNSVLYCAHASVPDGPPVTICSTFCLPTVGGACSIRDQSAELQMQTGVTDFVKSGFYVAASGSLAIRGVKFTQVVPNPVAFGVTLWRDATVFFEGCDLPGFGMFQGGGCCFLLNNFIHDGLLNIQGPVGIYNSYFKDIPSMLTPMPNGACCLQMIGCVAESCAPIGPRYDPILPSNRGPCSCLDMRYCAVFDAQPDQFLGYIADTSNVPFLTPGGSNTIPGHGIIVRGGCVGIDHVKIWGCAADGINAEFCPGCVLIRSVTGGTGGTVFGGIANTANGGFGINMNDGAHVIVQDGMPAGNTPASALHGSSGDLNVGTLGAKAWGAVAPRIYDITAVGAGGATGTGTYIAQKT